MGRGALRLKKGPGPVREGGGRPAAPRTHSDPINSPGRRGDRDPLLVCRPPPLAAAQGPHGATPPSLPQLIHSSPPPPGRDGGGNSGHPLLVCYLSTPPSDCCGLGLHWATPPPTNTPPPLPPEGGTEMVGWVPGPPPTSDPEEFPGAPTPRKGWERRGPRTPPGDGEERSEGEGSPPPPFFPSPTSRGREREDRGDLSPSFPSHPIPAWGQGAGLFVFACLSFRFLRSDLDSDVERIQPGGLSAGPRWVIPPPKFSRHFK